MKKKAISTPTQEISRIVQLALFDLGYYWLELDYFKNETFEGKVFSVSPVHQGKSDTYIILEMDRRLGHGSRWWIKSQEDEYEEITMWDLWDMLKRRG